MKVFINTTNWAIVKIDNEFPVIAGDNYVDMLTVYYDANPSTIGIYPTLNVLKPNGRKIGAIMYDPGTIENSIPQTYTDADSNTWYGFPFTLAAHDGILTTPGKLQVTITTNKCNLTTNAVIGQRNTNVQLEVLNAVVNDNQDIIVVGSDLDDTVTSFGEQITALQGLVAGLTNSKADKATIGYIELSMSDTSGELTADQLLEVQKPYALIGYEDEDGYFDYYYKDNTYVDQSDDTVVFKKVVVIPNNNTVLLGDDIIKINLATSEWTYYRVSKELYTTAKADELLATKADRNNPAQTIVVGAFTISGDTIRASESVNYKASDGTTGIYLDDDDIELDTDNLSFRLYEGLFDVAYHNRHYIKLDDNGYDGVFETFVKDDTNGKSKFTQTTYNFTFYFNDDGTENSVEITPTSVKVNNSILAEKSYVDTQDNNLQSQIDGLNAGQNLADIVADITALNLLSITNLKNGDKVQVLVDSNHDNASTVYKLVVSGNSHSWSYIGKYGQDGYTKAEANALLATKQGVIDSSHKLSADLVDDTSTTHKFVTAAEKAQITTNATAITNIKDGTTIDSFSDVESAISDITLSADNTSIEINSKVISVKSSYIDNQFLTDVEMEALISEVFD